MSFKQWLAAAAMVSVPFTALAQQKQSQFSPTDANAPVSAVGYQSAFKGYQGFKEESESPDTLWRAANDEVGKLGGHVGILKAASGATAGSSPTATPSGQAKPEAKAEAAKDHSKHH